VQIGANAVVLTDVLPTPVAGRGSGACASSKIRVGYKREVVYARMSESGVCMQNGVESILDPRADATLPSISIVVIGRNEGQPACLVP